MSSGQAKEEERLEALVRELRDFSDQDFLFSQAMADALGITQTDLKCLSILERTGATTAGKLAELTGLTSGAITGLIDRLEKGGWVRRVRDPKDRRHVIIESAREKEDAFDAVFQSSRDALKQLISSYSDEQLGVIRDFLHRSAAMMREDMASMRSASGTRGPGATGVFSSPLGALTSARLKFASGASAVTLRANPGMSELYTARFEGRAPSVREEAGTVSIQYPRFSLLDWRKVAADIQLNGSISWKIELKGGASKLDADLRELRLESLELLSGASQVTMALPPPSGIVPVRVVGGASDVTFTIPAKAAARLQAKGGVSALAFNEQYLGAVGGQTSLETPGYKLAADRYDFEVMGGASNLSVKSR
ncbi:MarR family winged helix-turn-helix transcriptional regulator [Pyxidicoccus xibeiensis]|uniref:MarR family winged helix-turn-helix transcriptional regulator n=1 Tax=Pyxidicoccus xibeiensis TaxID=2906759 RepID=UPI0020A797F4|nr:MarR family transcriptional regulator [Pyxidicoccus xibeiensis]MCP3141814.1 MarR family transcriptional regulator [Pyxidicoccus xibeiensis]